MRPGRDLAAITIKVPSPFAGVEDLGFSARYPSHPLWGPLPDVPLWIEGPAQPMRRLAARLRMLAGLGAASAHGWTQPVMLTDEVAVMAFQDRSLEPGLGVPDTVAAATQLLNLVRPVVFPFLQDCARVAHLRLTDQILMSVRHTDRDVAALRVRWDQIVSANGEDLLSA